MNVSSVKNLNGETFSAVQDLSLTNVVQTNSGNWNEISAYELASANYLTAHQDISNLMPKSESANFYPMTGNPSGFINTLPEEEEVEFEEINLSSYATEQWVGEQGYLTEISIPESANWNAATTTVQTNSSTWDNVTNKLDTTAFSNVSSTFLTAHQAISAEEWNGCYDNVNTNSGAWGGSALPISAGPGIKVNLVDNTLVFSNDETLLYSATGGNSNSITLNETPLNFNELKIYTRGTNWGEGTANKCNDNFFVDYSQFSTNYLVFQGVLQGNATTGNQYFVGANYSGTSGTTWTRFLSYTKNLNATGNADWANTGFMSIYKVIGVGRRI